MTSTVIEKELEPSVISDLSFLIFTIFDTLKLIFDSEAWGSKTKEMYSIIHYWASR